MPTFVHSKNAAVLVDQYELTSLFTKIRPSNVREMHDVTVLGASSRSFQPGLRQGEIDAEGLFNTISDTPNLDTLFGEPGTQRLISAFPEGYALGKPAYLLYADQSNFQIGSEVGDIIRNSAKFVAAEDGVDRGVSLHPLTAETGTGNGTSVDNSAASTGGWVAFLHVTAIAGAAPSVVVKIQVSTDNSSWGDLSGASFTAATAATKLRLEGTGSVARYARAVHTFGGTTTSITYQLSLARR